MTLPRLPEGSAIVRLYFNELYLGAGSPGDRVFHVEIQGQRVLENFDIIVAAGEPFKTTLQEFPAMISNDGILNITFVKGPIQNPAVAAIEIISNDDDEALLLQAPPTFAPIIAEESTDPPAVVNVTTTTTTVTLGATSTTTVAAAGST